MSEAAAAASRRYSSAEPPGLASRRLAVAVIASVLKHCAPLDETLGRLSGGVTERDRGLARAIATSAFRHLGTIRAALDRRLAKGLPRKAGDIEGILIAGVAQILFLNVPNHAAVDAAVGLARADHRSAAFAGLVNAVLRRIATDRSAVLAASDSLTDTPAWLRDRWLAHYGDEATAIAAAHGWEPGVDLTVKGDAETWAERLDGVVLRTGSLRLKGRAPVATLPGYAEGRWWVQDAAAALPARLLAPRPGERIADLCAAPGGKTAQLAQAGAVVTAVDRSPERLQRLKANMERLGLDAAIRAQDALTFDEPSFDAVLLDAPCTATGTIRRHPEVPWIKTPGDLVPLADLQRRLLDKAVALTRPGGRLVYCTCSLEPEEGEGQIEALLARHPSVVRNAIAPHEIGGAAEALTPAGDLRTLPSMLPNALPRLAGLDGFYAARLVRQA